MAKLYGDVPQSHRSIALALEDHEKWLFRNSYTMSDEDQAKFWVCLAHDWYGLSMDDEGERLLNLANEVCPGYFKKTVNKQAKEDPDFALLLYSLQRTIAADILSVLGVK